MLTHQIKTKQPLLFAFLLSFIGVSSQAMPVNSVDSDTAIHEYQLANGMKVLIKPDRRMPIAMVQVWYKVGGIDEPVGLSGISHMLEHMMFKGTKHTLDGEFSKTIHDLGGSDNAGTSNDFTYYYESVPAGAVPEVIAMEADRMHNLQFSEDSFLKERDVVMEERRMRYEDQPESLVYEQFFVTAHSGGPYRHLAIGWANDIGQYALGDLVHWYHKYYGPNNATVVVVGDVDPSQIYRIAKKTLGRVSAINQVVRKDYHHPDHVIHRSVKMKVAAKVPAYWMAFSVPNYRENLTKAYALDVFAGLLNGKSGLVAQELVRGKEILSSGNAHYDGAVRGDSLLVVGLTPASTHTIAEGKQAMQALLAHLGDEPVAEALLNRVKAQILADRLYQKDDIVGQALEMGYLETVGLGHTFADVYAEGIQKVTAKDVQAIAKASINFDHMTEATLLPESSTTVKGEENVR